MTNAERTEWAVHNVTVWLRVIAIVVLGVASFFLIGIAVAVLAAYLGAVYG